MSQAASKHGIHIKYIQTACICMHIQHIHIQPGIGATHISLNDSTRQSNYYLTTLLLTKLQLALPVKKQDKFEYSYYFYLINVQNFSFLFFTTIQLLYSILYTKVF